MTNSAATRTRQRRRLKYLLVPLPVVIGLLVVAGMIVGPYTTNDSAVSAYEYGDFGGSAEESSRLLDGNLLENWVPWFNRGNALAAQEEYTAAIDDFERALEIAPEERACDVRVNLALSWERLGDIYVAGGFNQGAINLYEAAKAVIAAGDGCDPEEPSGQQLDEAGPRVQAKIDEAQERKDQADAESGQQPGGLEEQLDQLGEQEQQGAQEKADGDSAERGQGGGQNGPTGKQW
jgi:tetratricopeptide (TPR) repeat protein